MSETTLPPIVFPPLVASHAHVSHDLINSFLTAAQQLLDRDGVVTGALSDHLAALTDIQAAQTQRAIDIDVLQQITDSGGAPLPPAGLALVTADLTALTVSWAPVDGANITYLVEWAAADDVLPVFTPLPTTAATQATITGLTAATDYAVRVSTVVGTLEGPPGTPVVFTTITAADAPVAPVVTLLGATSTTSISIQWAALANATQYEVGYLIASVWTSVAVVIPPTVQATLTGLTAGTAYTIQVRGDNGAVLGSLSAPIIVSTASAGPPAPAQPTGGAASNATVSSIDYTWTAFAAVGTPPADPGVRAPALTIAPGSVAYTFRNLAFQSTATDAPNFGAQVIDLTCTAGTLSFTPVGTATVRAGAQNSTFVSIAALWDDLIASAATITYHSPPALTSTTDAINIEFWYAGSAPTPQTGTIAVTITLGATTSESGGYNPLPVTYIPSLSADAGVTYTAFPPQLAHAITFTNLIASHPYSMRVHAVSQDGVAGIDSTVTTLSTVTAATGAVIGDPTGTQARRAHDFASTFGVGAYTQTNQDGGTKAEIPLQIAYICGGTGAKMLVRLNVTTSLNFAADYQALIAGGNVMAAPCISHDAATNAGMNAVINAFTAADIAYVEGINEPNIAFPGDGPALSAATILASQQALYTAAHTKGIKVALASVLYECSDQVTFWNNAGTLTAALAACDLISTHLYPNNGCYSAGSQLLRWTDTSALGGKHVVMTETNNSLYNDTYDRVTAFENITGYHALCGWAIGWAYRNLDAFVWFSLNDYASTYNTSVGRQVVGLFANSSANPHIYTTQIAAVLKLIADTGPAKATFTAGKINCTVTGLPAGSWQFSGGNLIWLQTSDGDFWGMLFNEQNQFSATTSVVHLAFGTPCALIEDYGITGTIGTQASKTVLPRTSLLNTSAIDIVLGTEFRLVHVRKPVAAPATALTAAVTIGATTTVYNPTNGTNLGDYVDPDGAFTQHCVKVTNAAVPDFTVFFRSDASGTRDEVVFEFGNVHGGLLVPYPAIGTYSVTIAKSGVTQATISVPAHYWRTRWRWQSAPRPVRKTTAQLIAAKLIPKYSSAAQTGTPAGIGALTYTPMTLPGVSARFGDTGDWPYIGPVTEYQGKYLCTGDSTALASMMAMAEGSGTVPWHYRDENTGAPLDINAYPVTSAYGIRVGTQSPWVRQEDRYGSATGSISGTTMTLATMNSGVFTVGQSLASSGTAPNVAGGTKIVSQLSSAEPGGALNKTGTYQVSIPQTVTSRTIIAPGIIMESAHKPAFVYVPFLMTGDPYLLEELQFSDLFSLIETAPQYRPTFGLSDQTRAAAWELRDRMQLAKVTPASVPSWLLSKSYYQTWLNTQRDYLINNHVNSTDPMNVRFNLLYLGINGNEAQWPVPPHTYFASWEEDYYAGIIGWTVWIGNADWVPIHNYIMKCALGRTSGTSGWPRAQPSNYRLQIRASGGSIFTASINGTTMTVTAFADAAQSALVATQALSSTGAGTNVTAGTTIVSQLSSSETGGALSRKGTYQVNISQTVPSKTITGAATPFVADWAAAWALRRQVFGLTGPDPSTVVPGDQTFQAIIQMALAIGSTLSVPGASAAYTWLHGQLQTLATGDPANHVDYKWSVLAT